MMKTTTTISGLLMAITSILTSCGVTVYDSQFAQAVSHVSAHPTAISSNNTNDGGAHSPHVHTDYNPLSSLINNTFHHNTSVIGPRKRSQHKRIIQMFEEEGRHAFDDILMPKLY